MPLVRGLNGISRTCSRRGGHYEKRRAEHWSILVPLSSTRLAWLFLIIGSVHFFLPLPCYSCLRTPLIHFFVVAHLDQITAIKHSTLCWRCVLLQSFDRPYHPGWVWTAPVVMQQKRRRGEIEIFVTVEWMNRWRQQQQLIMLMCRIDTGIMVTIKHLNGETTAC